MRLINKLLTLSLFLALAVGCGDDDTPTPDAGAGTVDAGGGGMDARGGGMDATTADDGGPVVGSRTATITPVGGPPTEGTATLTGNTLSIDVSIAAGGPGATQVILAQSDGEIADAAADTFVVVGTLDSADGFDGEMDFELPSGTDGADFSHVVIWCPTAMINFGVGSL